MHAVPGVQLSPSEKWGGSFVKGADVFLTKLSARRGRSVKGEDLHLISILDLGRG